MLEIITNMVFITYAIFLILFLFYIGGAFLIIILSAANSVYTDFFDACKEWKESRKRRGINQYPSIDAMIKKIKDDSDD